MTPKKGKKGVGKEKKRNEKWERKKKEKTPSAMHSSPPAPTPARPHSGHPVSNSFRFPFSPYSIHSSFPTFHSSNLGDGCSFRFLLLSFFFLHHSLSVFCFAWLVVVCLCLCVCVCVCVCVCSERRFVFRFGYDKNFFNKCSVFWKVEKKV